MDVVVIERVARRAVDQRRRQDRQPLAMADNARLRRPAGLGHLVEQYADQRIAGPGDRAAEIIEHALPRQLAHRLRQVTPAEPRRPPANARVRSVASVRAAVVDPSICFLLCAWEPSPVVLRSPHPNPPPHAGEGTGGGWVSEGGSVSGLSGLTGPGSAVCAFR